MEQASIPKSSTRAATGAGLILITQIVGYGLFFLAQRIVLSALSKEEFGSLSFIQQISSTILVVLVDAGMNNIAVREMVRRPLERLRIVASVFWIRIASTVLSGLVVATVFWFYNSSHIVVALAAVAMISLNSRSSMLRAAIELPFRENLNFRLVSLAFIADIALYFAMLFFFRAQLSMELIIGLQLLATLPSFFFIAWKIKLPKIIIPISTWSEMKTMLMHVRPLTAQLLTQNAHAAIDLTTLNAFAGLRDMGVFGAISNMGSIILTTYVALSSALFPMISEAIHSGVGDAKHRIVRTLSIITFVSVVLATTLSVLTPFITWIFTKDVYKDNLLEFQLQFWCAVFINIAQTGLLINSAQNVPRAMFFSGLCLVAGSLSADFILIPQWHTAGMMVAKSWSNTLSAALSLWFIAREYGSATIMRYVMQSAGVMLVCIPYSLLALHYMSMIPAALGALLLSISVSWMLGLVGADEWKLGLKLLSGVKRKLGLQSNAQA